MGRMGGWNLNVWEFRRFLRRFEAFVGSGKVLKLKKARKMIFVKFF